MIHYLPVEGLDVPELEVYSKLSEVQLKRFYEPHGGLFIAESPKVVLRALDAGCVPVSLLTEEKHIRTEAAEVLARLAAREEEISVYTGTYDVLTGLTGYALTRGVLCAMRRPPLRGARSLLDGDVCGSDGARIVGAARMGSEPAGKRDRYGLFAPPSAKESLEDYFHIDL